jgi:hypothetical protein
MAGMRDDPYRHVLDAVGECLGLLVEVASELQVARNPLSEESTRLLIGQTARQAGAAMAAQAGHYASAQRWNAYAKIGVVQAISAISFLILGAYLGRFCWP